ncbi:MAG TPA: glycosyltransferase [Candidatus Methylomirabilis sp.]|nr:glycosyltransferase [Candidatus Methylomirabilis sp.]
MAEDKLYPRISLITCTFNSEKYLPECLDSVGGQNYQNIEQIFVDNFSSDRTIEIIKAKCPLAKIIQKKTNIYEALNLGLAAASGEVVGIIHSDDVFYDNLCLTRVAQAFAADPDLDYWCGRMEIFDADLKKPFAILGAPPHRQKFREAIYSSSYYAHPTYYCRRRAINRVGLYDTKYKIAADIDWLIRLEKLNLKWHFDPVPLLKFRSSAKSTTSRKYFSALIEEFHVRIKQEGWSIFLFTIYGYHFSRRLLRYLLEKLRLNFLVNFFRKEIVKLSR